MPKQCHGIILKSLTKGSFASINNICDRLCENPLCSCANFELFLQFQNAITFT